MRASAWPAWPKWAEPVLRWRDLDFTPAVVRVRELDYARRAEIALDTERHGVRYEACVRIDMPRRQDNRWPEHQVALVETMKAAILARASGVRVVGVTVTEVGA